MDNTLDQFTFNSRPAAANYQHHRDTNRQTDKQTNRQTDKFQYTYKYTVIICNNANSVCQYCHIKIKEQDLMLLTKSQRNQNDVMNTPCLYGYHCDCFFLSSNVCKNTSELHGFSSLSKYHRQYIARKITNTVKRTATREVPSDLKVGYSILNRNYNHYCEQCNMVMLTTDIKIAGILTFKKSNDLVVYHPRCFSQAFGNHPIKLQGLGKLTSYDQAGIGSMLNIISNSQSFNRCEGSERAIDKLMSKVTDNKRSSFMWPLPDDTATSASDRRGHEQNRSRTSSSSGNKLWDSLPPTRDPPPHHSRHPEFSRKPEHSHIIPEFCRKPESSKYPDYPRKRKTSFKPNVDTSPRKSHQSSGHKATHGHHYSKRDNCSSSSSAYKPPTPSSPTTPDTPDSSPSSGKVELKKSTIRSEITRILYKYNHDYITSKIVRNMLMQKFECDLTPHKKYIDDTIMELLDVIDNNPINLKSIPGRIFVEEGDIEDIPERTSTPVQQSSSNSPVMSPMSANIDDISPFAIMSTQADEMALSNVDVTVNTQSSKAAWGDKSNSPTEKDKIAGVCDKGDANKTYALSEDDKPINLCECCLCCFRIQTFEEIVSLYNHVKTKHQACKTCVVCDIKFTDVYELMLHVAEFHRAKKAFRCKNCKKNFHYHAELSKHLDFCYLSESGEEEGEEVEKEDSSPVKSPKKKRYKFDKETPGMPELVNTLKNTQDTLDKIKTFISSESSPFEAEDL